MERRRQPRTFEDYADTKLLSEFPQSFEWAYQRLTSRGTIFFDTRTHRLLPEYQGQEVLIAQCLIAVVTYTSKRYGVTMKLSRDEKRLLAAFFAPFHV